MSSLSDSRFKMVEKTMRKHGYASSSLIESLHAAQEAYGYLKKDVLKQIARKLGLPFAKVFGVATFYHFFRLEPKGEHVAVVCMGTACFVKGADKILERLESHFRIKAGETTADELISLATARCVGACSIAPVVVVDERSLGNLEAHDAASEVERICHDSNL